MHTRPTVFFLPRAWSWRLVCTALGAAGGIAHPAQATQIPSTPPCVAAPAFRTRLPAAPGELLRYAVSVDGLAVGTIDFAIERVGIFAGEPAVVFRSAFQLDGMWAALAEVTGTATAVVARSSGLPLHATTDVTQRQRRVREVVRFSQGAQQLAVRRRVGPDAASAEVKLPANAQPTHDFLTALYNLRRLAPDATGCVRLYGNQHTYWMQLTAGGIDRINTPLGMRPADVFRVRAARLGTPQSWSGAVWLSPNAERVPYRMVFEATHLIEAKLQTYTLGRVSAPADKT